MAFSTELEMIRQTVQALTTERLSQNESRLSAARTPGVTHFGQSRGSHRTGASQCLALSQIGLRRCFAYMTCNHSPPPGLSVVGGIALWSSSGAIVARK